MPEQDEAETQPQSGEPPIEAPAEVVQPAGTESERLPEEAGQPAEVVDAATDPTTAEVDAADDAQIEAAEETQPGQVAPQQVAPQPEPRRLSRAERETYDRQRQRFTACSRCGYFMADCQIYLGEEAIQKAILASREGWLQLEGDRRFDRLVMDAYGVELDADYDYFDGSCPECRRRFVLIEQTDGPTRLKIRV